ncbi:MAG: component of SufBCD complex, partial [Paracoccaceae bacterium]
MKSLAVIRTHRWDEDAARLCAQLQPVFGDDLAVAFHNRPADVTPPIRVADIDDDWLLTHGLRPVRDWGWRCGDYFHYRARSAFPDYDYYWLIEPDVYFTGPLQRFFRAAAEQPQDILGVAIEPYKT